MTQELALNASTQLIHQLFYLLDERDYPRLASLFKSDGVWRRQGAVLLGHEQIIAALSKRSNTQRIRHVISNTFLPSFESGAASLIAYMTAYRFDDGSVRPGLVKIGGPFLLSVVHANLVMEDGAWKIAELDLVPQFEFSEEKKV
jgi:hypothetical protein